MTCRARGTAYDRSFRVLFVEGSIAVRSDADLIRLFLAGHREAAEAAFEALIARHGPMVLGVCRRILGDEHAAQDAFQTVFLILARKARSVQVDDSLGRWLHGVTRRVAKRAKVMDRREIPAPVAPTDRDDDDPTAEAVRAEARYLVGLEVGACPASSARRWPSFTSTGSRTTRRPRRWGCPWARSAAGSRGRDISSAHGSSAGDSPRRC